MDRRSSIKGLIVLGAVSFSSFTFYKWFTINSVPDKALIHQKRRLIAELAEVIIPRTDTPGAKDAIVEDFIVDMIEFCTDPRTQNNFLNGLNDLEKYTFNTYGKSFDKCTSEQQIQVVSHFEDKSVYSLAIVNKINNKFLGKPFFIRLKELSIEGYCTSQIGASHGLAYDYIPSSYQACIPLTKNQRSWATK